VRQRAHDLGVQLQFVTGSGPAGRIEHGDLDAYVASGGKGARAPASGGGSSYAQREGGQEIKIIGLRRRIAEKMQEAKRKIPHITYVEEVDATELEALRVYLNANRKPDQPKLTLLPFFIRAMAKVLPEHPQINARFDDEAGVLHQSAGVHVGIATQGPNGLLVPVVRHAEALDIWGCATEIGRVTGAARDGSAKREELSGSTITLTSLGTLGGLVHTPVINHPEVAIVGPNKMIERPVVRHGKIEVRKMMNISSSFDHRIVDGWDAATFIQKIKGLLEHPAALFVD
jgi:2-oxoisovalerate dehydrogenase E2 component (dihydrolipoyl transacylase)